MFQTFLSRLGLDLMSLVISLRLTSTVYFIFAYSFVRIHHFIHFLMKPASPHSFFSPCNNIKLKYTLFCTCIVAFIIIISRYQLHKVHTSHSYIAYLPLNQFTAFVQTHGIAAELRQVQVHLHLRRQNCVRPSQFPSHGSREHACM